MKYRRCLQLVRRKVWLLGLALAGISTPAGAQLGSYIGQPTQKLYVSPGQTFRVQLNDDWGVAPRPEDPSLIEFRPLSTDIRVFLHVRRMRVPQGASAVQVALNAKETRLAKLPGWVLQGERKAIVGGRPAMVITGRYSFQGNAQYPIVVEEVHLVVDEEAFVIHFECFLPAAGRFSAFLEQFYGSFVPRPSPEQLRPPPERSVTSVPF